jgi:rubrerythrin
MTAPTTTDGWCRALGDERPEHRVCRFRTPGEEAAVRHAEKHGERLRRASRMAGRVAHDCDECGYERPSSPCPHCGSRRPIARWRRPSIG